MKNKLEGMKGYAKIKEKQDGIGLRQELQKVMQQRDGTHGKMVLIVGLEKNCSACGRARNNRSRATSQPTSGWWKPSRRQGERRAIPSQRRASSPALSASAAARCASMEPGASASWKR